MKTSLASRLLAGIGLTSAAFSHVNSAPAFRGPTRSKRGAKKSRYVDGLMNHFARRQRDRMQAKRMHPLRDEHGTYTLTGALEHPPLHANGTNYPKRRKWLAGISAQRGY